MDIYFKKNDLEAAEACGRKCLKEAAEDSLLGNMQTYIAEANLLLANVAEARGDLEEAVKLHGDAVEICDVDTSLSNEMLNVTRRKVLLYAGNGEGEEALSQMGSVSGFLKAQANHSMSFIIYGRMAPARKLLRAIPLVEMNSGSKKKDKYN